MRLQFIFNNKETKVTTILFKNVNPILDIQKIAYFKETQLSGNWLKKEFRYSFDNIIWSNWATLTQSILANIEFTNHYEFYLEVLYTRKNYASANIEDFYLFYDAFSGSTPDPSTALIDADLLQGQPGSYYLNRDNQYGSFTSLLVSNIPDSSAIGIYDQLSRIDSSFGTELFFKRIEGVGSIIVREGSSGIIIIDSSGVGNIDIYTNPDPVTVGVGGILDSSTFFENGKSFSQTMEAMFYPPLFPTLTAPYNSFIDNASNIQEIGALTNIQFTASFNRGTIIPDYGTSGLRSGTPNTYHYTGTDISTNISSSNLIDIQNVNNYLIIKGIQTWTSSVSYNIGEQPLDSLGNPYSTLLPAGTTTSASTFIEGVYPLFGTTINILTYTKQTLVSMITGNNIVFSMVPESGGNKQSFEIPYEWLITRPLLGVQTFNTFSLSWDYQGGTAAASRSYWTISDVEESVQGSLINYKRYTYNSTDRSAIQIRIVF